MPERWVIMVHGGAKTIRPEREAANRQGCLAAVRAGQAVLEAGGCAVDAVVAAIRVLEDDPTFNAGYGSVLNADGDVECDAALMDGETLDIGAVAAVRRVRNPIDLAHALLRDAPVMLVGEGADRYAAEKGLALCDPAELKPDILLADEACDTVGCVAYDLAGRLAVGASTGGLCDVRPGRVGDAPIPGCGLAAERGVGAVAFSGDGESILRLTLASRVMHDLETRGPATAAERAIAQIPRVGGEAGCIVLDRRGGAAMAHNSAHFAVGFASSEFAAFTCLRQEEFPHG